MNCQMTDCLKLVQWRVIDHYTQPGQKSCQCTSFEYLCNQHKKKLENSKIVVGHKKNYFLLKKE